MSFTRFNFKESIVKTLEDIGFETPTEVQKKIIPLVMKNVNLCGRSPTGSGKTHAFLLPILQKIDTSVNKTQAIILSPTRELAKQIYEMTKPFVKNEPNLRVLLLTSGTDRNQALLATTKGPQLIIGTPGRVKDLAFDSASFNLTTASICVLDEADMILESGFMEEVGLIIDKLKDNTQFLCFSASLPEKLLQFLHKYIRKMEYVNLADSTTITSSTVTHIAYPTRNRDRLEVLAKLLDNITPYLVLLFASKKENVVKIYEDLLGRGYNVAMIHGDMSATNRKTVMKRVNEGRYAVVVASDIAARGIDIEGVSHVINYDLPYEEDFYFHRAGRTGRNGNSGVCYTLYDKEEIKRLESLAKKGIKFENGEFAQGVWTPLKPLFNAHPTHKSHPVNDEIRKIVKQNAKKPVKPNYKKKMKKEIERVKKRHKREIIEKDIRRQRVERYKKESRDGNSTF